jgi:tRNA acetyltransferase TAN1
MYDFNLLVSCSWGAYSRAKEEIRGILETLGELRTLFDKDPLILQHTLKWVPVDRWTRSEISSMKEAVLELKNKILAGERWRITVEKRRYTVHHKVEIIEKLAELIDETVDLEKPDKILRIDIIGKYAGLSILAPQDIFSAAKPFV